MRLAAIKIAIGIALLTILTLSIKGFLTLAHPSPELGVFVIQPSTSLLRFEEFGHTCGGPNRSWATGYIAYDGKRLTLSSATYNSPSEASHKLKSLLGGAIRIQEEGVKYNRQGRLVGERAVAFLVVDDKERACILWTQEESFFAIDAEALDSARAFEREKMSSFE